MPALRTAAALALVATALTVAPPARAQQQPIPTAQSVAAAVQSFYRTVQDMRVDFVQVSRNALAQQNTQRSGEATFARGGLIRMEYRSPAGDVIVSDGTTLWAHDDAAHQTVCSAAPGGPLAAAMSVFTGGANLAANFTLNLLNAQRYQYPAGNVLELVPTTPSGGVSRVLLYVDGASAQITRVVSFDPQGNYTRYDFSNPRRDTHPAGSLFHFANPPASQLVRAPNYTGPC